jgi:hypothetical protein
MWYGVVYVCQGYWFKVGSLSLCRQIKFDPLVRSMILVVRRFCLPGDSKFDHNCTHYWSRLAEALKSRLSLLFSGNRLTSTNQETNHGWNLGTPSTMDHSGYLSYSQNSGRIVLIFKFRWKYILSGLISCNSRFFKVWILFQILDNFLLVGIRCAFDIQSKRYFRPAISFQRNGFHLQSYNTDTLINFSNIN